MSGAPFFEGGGFRVTDTLLTPPRKTYELAQIEYVSVSRPLLLFVGPPALLAVIFVIAFRRYLYTLSRDFPLRGFISCADCDHPLNACWSTSKSGEKHPYY